MEVARALGLPVHQAMLKVVFALRVALPAMVGQFINLLQNHLALADWPV